jgi:hypothetical protein
VDEGERTVWWQGEDLAAQARYAANVMESTFCALTQLPGAAEEELRAGLADLRALPSQPGAGLGWVMHKSTAVR